MPTAKGLLQEIGLAMAVCQTATREPGQNSVIPVYSQRFRSLCRAAGWLLLVAIVAVTVSPITERPVSGFAPNNERAASFLTMGLLFGVG